MRFCIVLVVYDPHDEHARAGVLPTALRGVESLRGDFELVVAVNAAARCPRTVALLQTWCAARDWARLRLHARNTGIAAAFNAAVHEVLADYDAFVFMSGDALLVDADVLETLAAAFLRWPDVGALHPLSVFEDADDANYSPEWDSAAFARALERSAADCDGALDDDPFSDNAASLAQACKSRTLQITRPHLVLPLTFWAVRQPVLQAVGPLDERWRFCYENMDFALRAFLAGAASAVVLNAFVFHRRVLFRLLGSMDVDDSPTDDGPDGEALWLRKWGCAPGRAFDTARYGKAGAALLGAARSAGGLDLPGWRMVERRGRAALRSLKHS